MDIFISAWRIFESFFIWMGYDSFIQWVVCNTVDNLYWIVILGVPAVLFWRLIEDDKAFRAILRWFRRMKKPGPESYQEKYKRTNKVNRKLRAKVKELKSQIEEEVIHDVIE